MGGLTDKKTIIFCRDCRYMSTYTPSADDQTGFWCEHKDGLWDDVTETDFCSRAERKSDKTWRD